MLGNVLVLGNKAVLPPCGVGWDSYSLSMLTSGQKKLNNFASLPANLCH